MGNREDLLDGAKRCLFEKGYARTTIRDITSAAGGISMAAVGYHFGSKDELLNQALAQASGEWGRQLGEALAAVPIAPDARAAERFEIAWTHITASFAEHRRLWTATFDVIGQLPHVPKLREQLATGLTEARLGLAQLLGDVDPDAEADTAWAVGSFYQALLTGVMAQYLIDPDSAPTARDLALALQHIANGHP